MGTPATHSRGLVVSVGALALVGCIGDGDARHALDEDHITATSVTRTASSFGSATFAFVGTDAEGRDCTGTLVVRSTTPFDHAWTVDRSCALPDDPQRLATMCESGSFVEACGRASRVFRDGVGTSADTSRAFRLAATGCQAGVASACFYEGVAYEEGRGTPVDMTQAMRCYRVACEADDPAACANLGGILHDRTPPDEAGALEAFAHACRIDGGHGSHCHDHAAVLLVDEANHTDAEITEAIAVEERECEADPVEPEACRNLGVMYRDGNHVTADPTRALALFRSACDHELWRSCGDAGVLLYQGRGTPADPVAAVALFRLGCEREDGLSCRNLGVVLRDGAAGVPVDADASHQALERACNFHDAPACRDVGR